MFDPFVWDVESSRTKSRQEEFNIPHKRIKHKLYIFFFIFISN